MPHDRIDSLRGRIIRWTFTDGPTAGTTYEHRFGDDGSIGFRGADGSANKAFTPTKTGTVAKVRAGVFAVSYLSDSGFTLTAVLDFDSMTVVGFASNSDSWFQQTGTFELVDAAR
jgi:hypothetical protein